MFFVYADENHPLENEKLILLEMGDSYRYDNLEETWKDDIHYIIGSVGVQFECEEFIQYN